MPTWAQLCVAELRRIWKPAKTILDRIFRVYQVVIELKSLLALYPGGIPGREPPSCEAPREPIIYTGKKSETSEYMKAWYKCSISLWYIFKPNLFSYVDIGSRLDSLTAWQLAAILKHGSDLSCSICNSLHNCQWANQSAGLKWESNSFFKIRDSL